jgi:hypothetical protein
MAREENERCGVSLALQACVFFAALPTPSTVLHSACEVSER